MTSWPPVVGPVLGSWGPEVGSVERVAAVLAAAISAAIAQGQVRAGAEGRPGSAGGGNRGGSACAALRRPKLPPLAGGRLGAYEGSSRWGQQEGCTFGWGGGRHITDGARPAVGRRARFVYKARTAPKPLLAFNRRCRRGALLSRRWWQLP